jgi:hypothetical protein
VLKLQNKRQSAINQKLIYGDRALIYSVRPMRKEDIRQVTQIDREAFPTQWPPPNYQHELKNQLARYLVTCDDTKIFEEPDELFFFVAI